MAVPRGAGRADARLQRGYVDLWVRLVFGTPAPQPNASFLLEVAYPNACAAAPCPLFATQADHRRWAAVGLERGYVVAITPNADTGPWRRRGSAARRSTPPPPSPAPPRADDATDPFRLAYPDATWGLIRRRAWLGSRALDWLLKQSFVDPASVAVTGHSRNGKVAMIQAAYDERVTAVISSSSGAPAMSPYRCVPRRQPRPAPPPDPSPHAPPAAASCPRGRFRRRRSARGPTRRPC